MQYTPVFSSIILSPSVSLAQYIIPFASIDLAWPDKPLPNKLPQHTTIRDKELVLFWATISRTTDNNRCLWTCYELNAPSNYFFIILLKSKYITIFLSTVNSICFATFLFKIKLSIYMTLLTRHYSPMIDTRIWRYIKIMRTRIGGTSISF